MKRTHKHAIFTTFFALAAMILSAATARAQNGYRIEKPLNFAAGKTSKIVKGRIGSTLEAHEYKFKARANQFVEIYLKPGRNRDGGFSVLNAADEQIGEDAPKTIDWEGALSKTGEYRINVYSNDGAVSYVLTVKITNREQINRKGANDCFSKTASSPFDAPETDLFAQVKFAINGFETVNNKTLKKYLVEVRGGNFQLAGEPRRLAFLTARFVEAANENEAGRAAFVDVRRNTAFADRVHFEPGDAPRVFVESAREIEAFSADTRPLTGIIFYNDDAPNDE